MKRAFILCPGDEVMLLDHMVVRHEAVHAIQHCVNMARGTSVFTPIINDDEKLDGLGAVHLTLSDTDQTEIKSSTLARIGKLSLKLLLAWMHTLIN